MMDYEPNMLQSIFKICKELWLMTATLTSAEFKVLPENVCGVNMELTLIRNTS
jgi:hypothetical protein